LSIVFALERTNQLSLLPDKDLVDLCPPIEPYQVTKNPIYKQPNCADPQVKLAKKADLDWLFWAHSAGEIRLKFLDESGFSLWSPVS